MSNKEIVLMDLFSGIGGFSKGLSEAGFTFKKHYFSEVDKYAIANYKHNFKDAEYIGSVTDVHRTKERPNIITFGSPCQDFSIAGKRTGMEGQKSSLIKEAIRIIDINRPDIFIWENVKGAFSTNDGADFWAIIKEFTNLGGYRLEWQLLNTKWFLPQNRERIYLIGHLTTAGGSGREVFPFTKHDKLFTQGKRNQSQAQYSTTISSKLRKESTYIQYDVSGKGHKSQQDRVYKTDGDMGCLSHHRLESKVNIEVSAVLTPDRPNKRQNGKRIKESGKESFTLTGQDRHGVMLNRRIRRLTEIECERLQGYPDFWTKYGDFDGEVKEISSTQRYKMCGNTVTVDVVKAIGERLIK